MLTGRGVLLSDGPDHTRKRRLILPSLKNTNSLEKFVSIMEESAEDGARGLFQDPGGNLAFDVNELVFALAIQIVSLCLFSTDCTSEDIVENIDRCLDHVVYVSRNPFALPKWVPTRRNRRFRKSIKALDSMVLGLIEKGRQRSTSDEGGDDLLSMLVAARYEGDASSGLTDKELRDEIMTLFLAGHETTAITLAWTLWYLSAPENQHWQERIAEEALRVQNEMGGYSPALLEDREALRNTRAVLCEALRLRPPSWAVDRQSMKSTVLPKGVKVKRGDILLFSSFPMHQDPSYFGDDADEFNPSRFLTDDAATSTDLWDGPFSRNVYMPFGAGRKRCIGYRFAQWEMLVILSVLMRECHILRPSSGGTDELKWVSGITLRTEDFELVARPRIKSS